MHRPPNKNENPRSAIAPLAADAPTPQQKHTSPVGDRAIGCRCTDHRTSDRHTPITNIPKHSTSHYTFNKPLHIRQATTHPTSYHTFHKLPHIQQVFLEREKLTSLRDSRRGIWRLRGLEDAEICDRNQLGDGIMLLTSNSRSLSPLPNFKQALPVFATIATLSATHSWRGHGGMASAWRSPKNLIRNICRRKKCQTLTFRKCKLTF